MNKKIFIIAGEPSGDVIGAALMQACHAKQSDNMMIEWHGVGGSQMEQIGLKSLFPMTDIAVMGLTEVVPKLPLLINRIDRTAHAIIESNPDIVITIDAPDFSFRVVSRARKLLQQRKQNGEDKKITFMHYVAPTVWAWREKRAKKLSKLYDRILCLFDFEPPYFHKYGLQADFVGHPMVSLLKDSGTSKIEVAQHFNLPADKEWIFLLAGSRESVIKRHWPVMAQAAQKLNKQYPDRYHFICVGFKSFESLLDKGSASFPLSVIQPDHKKADLLRHGKMAMAVSGTIGLELAYLSIPHFVTYRLSWLSYVIAKLMVKVRYAHIANIIANQEIVPELLQADCTPEKLYQIACELLEGNKKQDFSFLQNHLSTAGALTPAESVAEIILDSISS